MKRAKKRVQQPEYTNASGMIEVKKETWRQKIERLEIDNRHLRDQMNHHSAMHDQAARELRIHQEYKDVIERILNLQ